MRILSLNLEHFRSYADQALSLGMEDVQLFVGPNGSGKTNLLEAVSLLSLCKSCRNKEDSDMVQWEAHHYRIRADVQNDAGERFQVEAVTELSPRRRKAFFKNGVRVPIASIIGFLPTVIFLPQDLELFSGAPSERRRFLDQLLCQLSPEYFLQLTAYQKVMKQRNALLKRIAAGTDALSSLAVWDAELAEKGSGISLMRLELIEMLNLSFAEELSTLQERWKDVEITYMRMTKGSTREALREEFLGLLLCNRERDVLLQSTTVGPHREDWQVVTEGRELPSFASRGQERIAVLALLLLEVSYLELRLGEKPVVLLDDVFSELDDAHQEALLGRLKGFQVLMTSTRIPPHAQEAALFRVSLGDVTRA